MSNNKPKNKDTCEIIQRDAQCVFIDYLDPVPGKATALHLHPNILHITYTQSGSGTCVIGNSEYELKPGTINIVYPYEPHAFITKDDNPFCNYNLKIQFKGVIPLGFPRMIKIGRMRRSFESKFNKLYDLFHGAQTETSKLEIQVLMFEIFIILIKQRVQYEEEANPSRVNNAFASSVQALQKPPFIFPGLDRLAKQCNMSKRSFTDFFHKMTGMSPRSFWLESKLSYAARLLRAKEYTVKEIAVICGFANSQNFIRAFKKRYTVTPKTFQTSQTNY
ncbi:MAG: AraC family transcriptional regulator [Lentisphaerae bacterium]|nr:AraC family transcriptional regulator [Lentisphaerota bacterium]MCP4101257.1 AraC family transcriptional regulator [Lentisphaerota bacterium]